MQPEALTDVAKRVTLDQVIGHVSGALPHLSTGDRARLRRGPLKDGDVGAPAFWKLAAHEKYGFKGDDKWAAILQAMAILTPRPADGDDNPKGPHDPSHKFGMALCDGGDKSWGQGSADPRPVLSELRLAKMLAAKGELRRELVIRAAKIIAKSGPSVNCADIARFILNENIDEYARQIAKHYYIRLSRAANGGNADDDKPIAETQE
ncbi:type I-E CRISPR-associated protein Cse2/CasB [Rhodomicrobium vannielii ATCC 17100]|uniref:type I-E CRISPR-associated protein Cse2/CasB n=1 Tax=Rhodomicrobium vannielii TaxID=1069 RepID=UPI00191A6D85|nr:type I-E CRISPR-associated protein Cse2/CasB [Rhodomicrobium vannielii]MBJ7533588.1 type I-E CRISPR-associated protein Cse2/CasB [Rhodomicrobium vannielii ATCC 17100]